MEGGQCTSWLVAPGVVAGVPWQSCRPARVAWRYKGTALAGALGKMIIYLNNLILIYQLFIFPFQRGRAWDGV